MDLNKIDRLASARAQYGVSDNQKHGIASSVNTETDPHNIELQRLANEEIANGNFTEAKELGITDTVAFSQRFEIMKNKRSQGMNQVANSLKIRDRIIKCDISVAMISNIIFEKDLVVSKESSEMADAYLSKIQILFDEFLLNIHDEL